MTHNTPISKSKFHHHYAQNTIGRDFIVGDIQGCFDELMGALELVHFDKEKDRLFCVGDLIDRGPKSLECAQLVYESWCHSVLGNHEELMFESILNLNHRFHACWIQNGGLWYMNEDSQVLEDIAKQFTNLPLVISVGNAENRFNIVHAELLRIDLLSHTFIPVSDSDIDNWTFHQLDEYDMKWGRRMIDMRNPTGHSSKLQDINASNFFQSDKLSTTYCGHSIVPHRPIQIEKQIFLDTGAVSYLRNKQTRFNINHSLTLASPSEQIFYIYHPGWKTIVRHSYNQLRKYS